MDFGDNDDDQVEAVMKSATAEEWGELFESPVEHFEHVTIDGREGLTFSVQDADMGLVYYLVGPVRNQNMWALVDTAGNNEEVFHEMVKSAVIK